MITDPHTLDPRAAALLRELHARQQREPWRWVDPLPGQLRFAESRVRNKLFRAGNQAKGKTTAGIIEALGWLTGEHPWLPDWRSPYGGPVRGLCVAGSHQQSLEIQRKIAALVSPAMLADGCFFDAKKGGFVGKYPRLRLRNGSELVFASGQGDTISLAGGTYHFAWFDEPPESERVYLEVQRRLTKTAGYLYMTFTPVNRDVQYLRKMAQSGQVVDIHDPLTPESLVHCYSGRVSVLADGTPCDAAWIEAQRKEVPEYAAGVLLDGDWEERSTDRAFGAWTDSHVQSGGHLTHDLPAGSVTLHLGIDHGTGAGGNQCAVLVAREIGAHGACYWVIDEWMSDGRSSVRADAQGILAMLERNVNGGWSGLTGVFGDIPVGQTMEVGRKSNKKLAEEVRLLVGMSTLHPPIRTVKKVLARGAVYHGMALMHDAMTRDGFRVHPRCLRLRECLSKWKGDSASEYKHLIDALRYAIADDIAAWGRGQRAGGPSIRVR